MSPNEREIKLAQEYAAKAKRARISFSPDIETAISKAFKKATIFDIETGGLSAKDPIYELGFQHGLDNPRYSHHFVNPTNIKGTKAGEMTQFAEDLLTGREKVSPTIRSDIASATLGQKDAARTAYSELSGRDVWVQNLNFESRSLGKRTSKSGFTKWAEQAGLESYTNSGRLFTTTPSVKRLEANANAARGVKEPLDSYLSKWSSVFDEIDKTLLGPRGDNVTRVFDTQTLTKSVFAMAQQRELMPKTGELFSGTAINTLSEVIFGITEPHSAVGDSVLQGELTRFMYGTGKMLKAGEELSPQQKKIFTRLGEVQQTSKQRGAAKNILNTFRDQQSYLASVEAGSPDKSLRKNFRTDFDTEDFKSNLKVRNPDGSYTNQRHTFFGRSNRDPQFTTDIDELVSAWKVRDASSHGIRPDYDSALKEVRESYINPYNEKLKELGGDRRAALAAMEPQAEVLHGKINQDISDTLSKGAKVSPKDWLKKNWKLSAGVAASLGLVGYMFSGKDDEYNYIEGLRHGGFAGSTRKYNTDFGSGWRGLKSLLDNPATRKGAVRDLFGSTSNRGWVQSRLGAYIESGTDESWEAFAKSYTLFKKAVKAPEVRFGSSDLQIHKTAQAEWDSLKKLEGDQEEYVTIYHGTKRAQGENLIKEGPKYPDDENLVLASYFTERRDEALFYATHRSKPHPAFTGEMSDPALVKARVQRKHVRINYEGGSTEVIVPKHNWGKIEFDIESIVQTPKPKSTPAKATSTSVGSKSGAALPTPVRIVQTPIAKPEMNRVESNISPKIIETVEKHAVTPKNQPIYTTPTQKIESTQSNNSWMLPAAATFGLGTFWAMQGSSGSKDFGSPWHGLNKNPDEDKRVAKLKIEDYYVEDADTVQIMLEGGNKMTLRLAGIDAPEVEHGDDYASDKIFQKQPFGEEATEILEQLLEAQDDLYALFDPEGESTYGRTPALLFGDDDVNINLELVRKGAAAALPFGKAKDRLIDSAEFKRAQEEAFASESGMWSDAGWRIVHDVQSGAKKKLTHNTFTSLERIFKDFRSASIVHRLRNSDADFSQMQAIGGRDDHNIIEGLRHGWATANREANIGDFGSGYRIDKVINTMKLNTKTKRKLMRGQRVANTHAKQMMDPRNWTQHHKGN